MPALTDPATKATIDLLNECDMRDQVGSYRVIVSYETPQLEEFSLCTVQQNPNPNPNPIPVTLTLTLKP